MFLYIIIWQKCLVKFKTQVWQVTGLFLYLVSVLQINEPLCNFARIVFGYRPSLEETNS